MSSTTKNIDWERISGAYEAIRSARNTLLAHWRESQIPGLLSDLEEARRSHPALRLEAPLEVKDLGTHRDARYLVARFARLTGMGELFTAPSRVWRRSQKRAA